MQVRNECYSGEKVSPLPRGSNFSEGDIQPREFVILIVSYRVTTTATMRMTMTVAAYQACAFISPLAPFALLQRNAHRGRFNDPISVCDLAWPWKTGRMLRDWQRGLALRRKRKRERKIRRRRNERGRGGEGQVTSNLWKVRGRHRPFAKYPNGPVISYFIEPNFDTMFLNRHERNNSSHMF